MSTAFWDDDPNAPDDDAWITCRPCSGEGVIEHLRANRPPELCAACHGNGGALAAQ